MTNRNRHASHGLFARLDAALYRRGFTHAGVRELVRIQIVIGAAACLLGALAWTAVLAGLAPADAGGLARKVVDFAAGVVLIGFNFYGLAKFGQFLVFRRSGALAGQLARFYVRLTISGVILYFLVIPGKADLLALFAGLSSVVVTALAYAFNHASSLSAGRDGSAGGGAGKSSPGAQTPGSVLKEAC